MAKTAALAVLPVLLIVTGWQGLEEPVHGAEFFLAALLAVGAAILPQRRFRIPAAIAAGVAVVAFAFDLSPLDARPFDGDHDFFGPLLTKFGNGIADFYEVGLPFDPADQPAMHGAIVLAVFAFTLLATLAIAAGRPILAAAATFAGGAWPATLVPGAPVRGVLLLVTALLLLAAMRPGARPGSSQALGVGAGVVVAALVAVSSPSVAKGGFLDWQNWNPDFRPGKRVSVEYVWDANYAGIDFPKTATTVLKVKAARNAPYWRATTLDVFLDDHWREDSRLLEPVRGGGTDSLLADPLLPRAARNANNWRKQDVTVEALVDTHLVGASVPVAFEQGRAGSFASGIAYVGRLERGQRYSVWSYVARPTPGQLARSRPIYPPEILYDSPFLNVASDFRVPPFGLPGREEALDQLFTEEKLAPYEALYRQAERVVGRPPNPYAAAVALEAWFRSSGEFVYDEHPPRGTGAPPLVAFATGHRTGYCQHFAGAMALMLRYLGIPARVAAGFTNGRFEDADREWTVLDTNAHTWVEVWFRGYGWLPFDPTPGRGRLRGEYTSSSLFFDAPGATAAFAGAGAAALGLNILRNRLGGSAASPDDRPRGPDSGFVPGDPRAGQPAQPTEGRNDQRILVLVLAAAAGILALFWVAKSGRRRWRYTSDDPRRVAAAVRAELVDYLADQRVRLSASATPAELGRSVHERFRVDADGLAVAIAEARFGPSEDAVRAAAAARRELRRVLKAVRRRIGVKRRLRGLVSLRSFALRLP